MALSLKESRALRELADTLYDFLPGSGSAAWKGHVSFKSVAEKVGVGDFWQPGSKLPMLTSLLERTLQFRRGRFEPLVVEIVRAGLTYRQKNGKPLTSDEVEGINGLILEIGFKLPDLWDQDFLASLRAGGPTRATERIQQERAAETLRESQRTQWNVDLEALKREFLGLHESQDRQLAGLQLEKAMNKLSPSMISHHGNPFALSASRLTVPSNSTTKYTCWRPSGSKTPAWRLTSTCFVKKSSVSPSSLEACFCPSTV